MLAFTACPLDELLDALSLLTAVVSESAEFVLDAVLARPFLRAGDLSSRPKERARALTTPNMGMLGRYPTGMVVVRM